MARVTGDAELRRNLRTIADVPTGRALDLLCVGALEPMRQDTAARATRHRIAFAGDVVTAKIAAGGKYRRTFWISFKGLGKRLAHIYEFGTLPHSTALGARRREGYLQHLPPFHPGSRPRPFMRPAFEATKAEVAATFGKRLWDALTTAIRK